MSMLCHDPPLQEAKPAPKLSDSVMEMFSLKGKVAVITGAGGGIGYQVCRAYAEAGANLGMWYRSSTEVVQMAKDLSKEFGVECRPYQVDVTDSATVTSTMDQVNTDFGRIDIVVANAGMIAAGPVGEMTDDKFLQYTAVNYHSLFYTARAVAHIFQEQGSGSFICTASMSGSIVNVPNTQVVYNAAKAACIHFCKSLSYDWKDFARVNTVSPGYINTDMGAEGPMMNTAINMSPLGRTADAKELKGIYLYLASSASSFTTGADFIVDGGYTVP